MKLFISFAFCVIFAWGALALWNWAEVLAKMTDTNAQLFDFLAVLSLVVSMGFATWCNQLRGDGKEKH